MPLQQGEGYLCSALLSDLGAALRVCPRGSTGHTTRRIMHREEGGPGAPWALLRPLGPRWGPLGHCGTLGHCCMFGALLHVVASLHIVALLLVGALWHLGCLPDSWMAAW